MNIKNKPIKIQFPDPRILPEESDGLIYVGGNLEISTLVMAYRQGIYPWPLEASYPLFWFCPEPRGIIDFTEVHIPKSLEKIRKKNIFKITVNQAFPEVIQLCAKQERPGQDGTWIIPEMIPAYIRFHEAGYAHSVECWRDGKLVGGLYGVYVDGVFSGESMFYLEPNTSKLCFIELVERLRQKGLTWMDIQMTTPVTEALGGKYITRTEFLNRLAEVHSHYPDHKLALHR